MEELGWKSEAGRVLSRSIIYPRVKDRSVPEVGSYLASSSGYGTTRPMPTTSIIHGVVEVEKLTYSCFYNSMDAAESLSEI